MKSCLSVWFWQSRRGACRFGSQPVGSSSCVAQTPFVCTAILLCILLLRAGTTRHIKLSRWHLLAAASAIAGRDRTQQQCALQTGAPAKAASVWLSGTLIWGARFGFDNVLFSLSATPHGVVHVPLAGQPVFTYACSTWSHDGPVWPVSHTGFVLRNALRDFTSLILAYQHLTQCRMLCGTCVNLCVLDAVESLLQNVCLSCFVPYIHGRVGAAV